MAIPISAHLNMGSPLYALYRTYLSISNVSNVVPEMIGRVPSPITTQLRALQRTALADLGIAMYQLGMLEFLDDLDRTSPTLLHLDLPPPLPSLMKTNTAP